MARILVVDGARVTRRVAALLLASLEHDVVGEAATLQEAVAAVVRFEPEVVLIDVGLLGDAPAEALARFADVRPSVQIVACAALDEAQALRSAVAAGATGGVQRPFARSQLARALGGAP